MLKSNLLPYFVVYYLFIVHLKYSVLTIFKNTRGDLEI